MKAFFITWKDTLTRMRDLRAVMGFIIAPLLISFIVGSAFGNAFKGESPVKDIAVVVVNEDEGDLGNIYADVLSDESLDGLFAVTKMDDLDAAIMMVQEGETRGLIHIPAGFSAALFDLDAPQQQSVEVVTDPTASVSPYIIKSVVEQISANINTLLISSRTSVDMAVDYAAVLGPALANLQTIVSDAVQDQQENLGQNRLGLELIQVGELERDLNPFAYFVPGMAIFFLMFSAFDGTRAILQEETMGTLPRLMSTPTSTAQIILGKIGGAFFGAVLQFLVLVLASALIFDLHWGDSVLTIFLMMLSTVLAATSLGAFLASFARDENQAGILGSAIAMLSGALGGSFASVEAMPAFLQFFSKLTVNRWAMDGFLRMTLENGSLASVLPFIGVLLGMAAIYFLLAVLLFRRRFVR